ncbi:protein of unknown function [Pseudorhizobium banfieldiae]|uniref:Uncharacterized protein n=1 Tax=Pseudorhizobium banfieldiae TaxID=1125847 RepID=L0NFU1_9HYPH|nr:hypothetical protein [Pseudorhizobium banfieldiae]CAD6606169.1 hypothetical protein RNT25_01802 [arsenite-oxidising bacterium NT-25]CCF19147.1 protein of unknown function [Pseudorhizobium banfieldiae]
MIRFLNVSTMRVGGIRFLKIGRLTFSFCVSSSYRPVGQRPVRQIHRTVPGAAIRFVQYAGALALLLPSPALAYPDTVLIGIGCQGQQGEIYRLHEDEFPQCQAIAPIDVDLVPACPLADLLPTDGNIEACTGRPWHE